MTSPLAQVIEALEQQRARIDAQSPTCGPRSMPAAVMSRSG
jgi:hypothetical protein